MPDNPDKARILGQPPAGATLFGLELGCGQLGASDWKYSDRPRDENGTERFFPLPTSSNQTYDFTCDGSLPATVDKMGANGTQNGTRALQP